MAYELLLSLKVLLCYRSRITTKSIIVFINTVLFALVGSVFAYNSYLKLKNGQILREKQIVISELGRRLQKVSDYLSREARLYTVAADEEHLTNFWQEVNVKKTREKTFAELKMLGIPDSVWSHIADTKEELDLQILTEKRSMIAVKNGDLAFGRELLMNQKYADAKNTIYESLDDFQSALNTTPREDAVAAADAAIQYFWLSVMSFTIFLLYICSVCYFFLIKQISEPVTFISRTMNSIAGGTSIGEIEIVGKHKEIRDLARAASVFNTALEENRSYVRELAMRKEHLEEMVDERTRELNDANKELEVFSYRISHDLRSPLVSSIRLMEMSASALSSKDYDTVEQCTAHSTKSLKKLESLISSILVLVQNKHTSEESEVVDIPALIEDSISLLKQQSDNANIEFCLYLNHTNPVVSQPVKLSLILENLLSNAIKYYDPSKENSWINITSESTARGFSISIKDNGLGIEPQYREKLFLMFERFHTNVSFGSGLGLYLVKKTAHLLNGDIQFIENPDGGSEFKLTLNSVSEA